MPTFGGSYTPTGQTGGVIGPQQTAVPFDPGMARRMGANIEAAGGAVSSVGQTIRESEDLNFLQEKQRAFDAEATAYHQDWESRYDEKRLQPGGTKKSTSDMVRDYKTGLGKIRDNYLAQAPRESVRRALDGMTYKTYSKNSQAASQVAVDNLTSEAKANLATNIEAYKVQGYMSLDQRGWAANYLKGIAAIEAQYKTGLYMDAEEYEKQISAFRSQYWADIAKKQASIDAPDAVRENFNMQWDRQDVVFSIETEDGDVESYTWQQLVGSDGVQSLEKFKNDQGHRAAAMEMSRGREAERQATRREKEAKAATRREWLQTIKATPASGRPALLDQIYSDPRLDEDDIRLLEKRTQGGAIVNDSNSLIEIEEMRDDPTVTEDVFDDRVDQMFKENKITEQTWESERGSKSGEYKEAIRESIDYMRGFYQRTGIKTQDILIASQFARDKREVMKRIRAGEDPEMAVDEVILRKDIKLARPSRYTGDMTVNGLLQYIDDQKALAAEGNLESRALNINVEAARNAIQLVTDLEDIKRKNDAHRTRGGI